MAAHRYWRVRCPDTHIAGEYMGCTELEMRATSGGADQTGGKTASASVAFGGYPASAAIDNNTGSFWTTGGAGPPAGGHWLRIDFGAGTPVDVVEISYKVRPDSYREDPKDLYVEYSDDASSWTTLWSQLNIAAWSAGETRVFTYSAPVPTANLLISKQIAYAAFAELGQQISKQIAYAVFGTVEIQISKQIAYAVFNTTEIQISKQTAYAVFMPASVGRRMSLM